MSDLSAVEAKLPPGFRFHPKDEELVCDYLMKKVTSANDRRPLLIEVDLNKCEPWDIPESALVGGKECYFYSQRDRKYSTGLRTNRATATGYWKATGKDRPVLREGTLVGMRKTLVFYQGRAPKGRKTDWVMHEFRLEGPLSPPKLSTVKDDWVLCRVLLKNRDEVTKQDITGTGTGGCRGNTSPSSTSPPYTMTSDDQTHRDTNNVYDQLQVPAGFSILTPHQHDQNNQNSATTFSYISQMNSNFLASANFQQNSIGGFGMEIGSYLKNTSSSGDDQRKVMKAVLNELASTTHSDVKGRSLSFGEESSESFLSDVELSNMWNHYS